MSPIVYVDDELKTKLTEMAKDERRTVVAVLRRLVGLEPVDHRTTHTRKAPVASTERPEEPEERWAWVKDQLGVKCGCVFDDMLNVRVVTDPGLFRVANNGALMEKYLAEHPEERENLAIKVEGEHNE